MEIFSFVLQYCSVYFFLLLFISTLKALGVIMFQDVSRISVLDLIRSELQRGLFIV